MGRCRGEDGHCWRYALSLFEFSHIRGFISLSWRTAVFSVFTVDAVAHAQWFTPKVHCLTPPFWLSDIISNAFAIAGSVRKVRLLFYVFSVCTISRNATPVYKESQFPNQADLFILIIVCSWLLFLYHYCERIKSTWVTGQCKCFPLTEKSVSA
jgi:hypothetical protein